MAKSKDSTKLNYWFVRVRHKILVDGKLSSRHNHEERSLIVMAKTQAEAEEKIREETEAYGKPYNNCYQQPVSWQFDCLLEITEIDYFNLEALLKGVPMEVYAKFITRSKK